MPLVVPLLVVFHQLQYWASRCYNSTTIELPGIVRVRLF